MQRNPIKHVKFSDIDYFQPERSGGGSNKPFKAVTFDFRKQLIGSLNQINQKLVSASTQCSIGVGAAVVELEDKAIAKSHRPREIFNQDTCEFIGDVGFAKFLVQVTPTGLTALANRIQTATSKAAIKDLSTIKSIAVFQPQLDISISTQSFSVRLFRFKTVEQNQLLEQKFEVYISSLGGRFIKHPSNAVRLYKVFDVASQNIADLVSFIGVKSVVASNSISVAPMALSPQAAAQPSMSPPEPRDYPVVGVVDSGVSYQCTPLEPWVVDRKVYVAEPYRNFDHGTFVSGLVASSYHLNGQDVRFPRCQSKILSVEVLGDSNHTSDMFDVVYAMYEAANEYPDVKVWNLSLSDNNPVSMSNISDMALMLDEFQDRQSCLCIVATGNYTDSLRAWPPTTEVNNRIGSPGDSVRSITVGSLAHVDGFVKNLQPSHFTRKGPVSNYLQKPELVHFGGNMLIHNQQNYVLGVNSVCVNGLSREDLGTSFSTPLISSVAANLFHQIGDHATPTMVKALMVHSANLNPVLVEQQNEEYFGWGMPKDSQDILEVKDYETTLIFEGNAWKSFEVQKLPFPIPQCLRTEDGKVRAEFYITLAYLPELDSQKAFEYCQVDLSVGLGEYDSDGKFKSKVPIQSNTCNFEQQIVKSGDKWAPIKVYKKTFPKGIDVTHWKLRVSMLERDGYDAQEVAVPFVIVLTIRDIDKQQPVYNQMSQLMDQYNWNVSDLVVDSQIQVS